MSIHLFVPKFEIEECLNEIRTCFEIGWTGLGFKTNEFEEAWKKYTGLPNAHFLNSATAGLNLSFEILKEIENWSDYDEIITTPITFISTNHAILLSNLKPVFADVDDSLCLDPIDVEKKITNKTKGILFVGIGGNIGQYFRIVELCKKYKLKLLLDAAHMAGTKFNGNIVGSESDVVIYSFQAVKNLPTADSGMICFKDSKLDEIVRKKSWLGINKNTYERSSDTVNKYKWKYDVEYVGNKTHGNSIMAAIGLVQLRYLERDNHYRQELVDVYRKKFNFYSNIIKMVKIPDGCQSSNHLFQIIVKDRDELLTYLNQNDIFPGVHYIDNTEYRMYQYAKNSCPNASYISKNILSLPLHLRLSKEDVNTVANKVIHFIKGT